MRNLDALSTDSVGTPKSKLAKKRDLSELDDIDVTTGVDYKLPDVVSHMQKSSAESSTPLSEPKKQSASTKHFPIEIRLPNGRYVTGYRTFIANLNSLTIFDGNPRAKTKEDVSGLAARIKVTKGNITPVVCLETDTGRQLLAGTRRYRASLIAETSLLADVITEPLSELECEQIAFEENTERKDPDVWDMAAFYVSSYQLKKRSGENLQIEAFGEQYGLGRQAMSTYMGLAKVPTWIYERCPRTEKDEIFDSTVPTWSFNLAKQLKKVLATVPEQDHDNLSASLATMYDSPASLIKAIAAYSQVKDGSSDVKTDAKTDLILNDVPIGAFTSGKRKKGLSLKLNENAPDALLSEIKNVLKKYGLE
jgi:ParB/RepB/Spo0J family partition protein